jgi:tRNA 2-thiouridine synthesizing protein D
VADGKLRYTLILTHSPSQLESNNTAQELVAEIIAAGDHIDRIFFYQDACFAGLESQVPGQGLVTSFLGWQQLNEKYQVPLQVCIANGLRRGVLNEAEAQRYQASPTLHSSFTLVGLGELAEANQQSDRIITL